MSELLIEGFRPEQLPEALGPELEDDILRGRPIVARAGTAEILMAIKLRGSSLRAELAHVDGGGEGVLPALFSIIIRLARQRGASEVEWLVFATNCARPNPRLQPVLERCGFIVTQIPERGFCYYRRDGLKTDE